MIIRKAHDGDLKTLLQYDRHIRESELVLAVRIGRVLIAEEPPDAPVGSLENTSEKQLVGFLRWNMFWDNTPFMNLIYIAEPHRGQKKGAKLIAYWEQLMKNENYTRLMTSSLANERAQNLYRRLGYIDSGSLLLKNEPLEIIFTKEL